jgi:glucosamine--fructose-6-phosphate aminotransferase (isomerizing)
VSAPAFGEIAALVEASRTLLADDAGPAALAADLVQTNRMFVAGRGLLYGAALETALKIKETTRLLAEGISVADLLHGPIAAVGEAVPVLSIDEGSTTVGDSDQLAERLTALGAFGARCSPAPGSLLNMPIGLAEGCYPVLATIRGQQLAYHLARALGLNPDRPSGLTKVTPTH